MWSTRNLPAAPFIVRWRSRNGRRLAPSVGRVFLASLGGFAGFLTLTTFAEGAGFVSGLGIVALSGDTVEYAARRVRLQ